MLPTEDLFVYVYALIDDAIKAGAVAIPPRPGPSPACSDAELLAIAMVRHLSHLRQISVIGSPINRPRPSDLAKHLLTFVRTYSQKSGLRHRLGTPAPLLR